MKFGLFPECSFFVAVNVNCWSLIMLFDWECRQASAVLYLCLRCVEVFKLAGFWQYRGSWCRCGVSW